MTESESDRPAEPETTARSQFLGSYIQAEVSEVPHVLRTIGALSEIVAVCESIDAGAETPQHHDLRSLRADVQSTLTKLGPHFQRELEPTRSAYFHDELAKLPTLLEQRAGVKRLQYATQVLIDRVRRPESSQAAWRDAVAWTAPFDNATRSSTA